MKIERRSRRFISDGPDSGISIGDDHIVVVRNGSATGFTREGLLEGAAEGNVRDGVLIRPGDALEAPVVVNDDGAKPDPQPEE